MNRPGLSWFVLLLCSTPLFSQQKSAATKTATPKLATPATAEARTVESPAKLPVRRVVLYKNGVGYFEHLGRVAGSQDVHIDFTGAQLNDVLMSLTVLDLSGGRIHGRRLQL